MTKKEIVSLYLLEGVLGNMTKKEKSWDDIFMSSPSYGVITFEDMYDAIMNGKILPIFDKDYVDLFMTELVIKGIPFPKEENVHTIDELRVMYPILEELIKQREEDNQKNSGATETISPDIES